MQFIKVYKQMIFHSTYIKLTRRPIHPQVTHKIKIPYQIIVPYPMSKFYTKFPVLWAKPGREAAPRRSLQYTTAAVEPILL